MPVTAQSPPRVATFGESMALLSSSCLGSLALQPSGAALTAPGPGATLPAELLNVWYREQNYAG